MIPIDPDVDRLTTWVGKRLETSRRSSRTRNLVMQGIPVSRPLAGPEGFAAARQFASTVEDQMARQLGRCDAVAAFHALRGVSRRLWATTAYDPAGAASRKIAEIAVIRHGRWPRHGHYEDRRHVWSRSDANAVADLLLLAELYLCASQTTRNIAKGQTVTFPDVTAVISGASETSPAELGLALRDLDRRRMTSDDGLSEQGLTSAGNTDSVAEIVVAQWRPVDQLAQEAAGAIPLPVPVASRRLLAEHDVLADWGYRSSIGEMLDALGPVRDDLVRHHGCSLEDAVVLLHHLGVTIAPMAHPDRSEALHRFGYIATPWPTLVDLDGALDRAIGDGVEGADRATPAGIRAAVAALTATPETLTLHDPPYRRPFIRAGDTLIYDALGCHLPSVLTHETPFDERTRQHLTRTFERQVHALLSRCGRQPFGPGTDIEEEGQRQTDLDASVVVDGMLIAVDCYSSPWTQALDVGEYRTTSNRAKGLVQKLAKWEEQWRRLAEGMWIHGVNVDAVLPVVVTASAEWLGDLADQPRFSDTTPRILTARELVELLTHRPTVARDRAISVGA